MKSWIWLFIIGTAIIGVVGNPFKEIFKTCMKETDVTREDLDDDQFVSPGNNHKVKCFVACCAKKQGWMTKDGDIIADRLLTRPKSELSEEQQERLEKIFVRCTQKRKDDCATAYFVKKCVMAHMQRER